MESEIAAHREAASRFFDQAMEESREFSWHVYRMDDGSYSYSYPAKGEQRSTVATTSPWYGGEPPVSSGHIHWDEQRYFSGLDWLWVNANRRPLYLVNRDEEMHVLQVYRSRVLRRNGRSSAVMPRSAYPGRLLQAGFVQETDQEASWSSSYMASGK
jgi:hypothetical protein